MPDIEFFDAHVAIGPRKVIFPGQDRPSADAFPRLAECGITAALVHHNAAVEDNPVTGNAMLMETLRGPGIQGLNDVHPVWAVLPFTTNEQGSSDELRRALKAAGVKGVLLYPAAQGFSPAPWCSGTLYELLEAIRMPTFVRFNPQDFTWNELHDLLAAHPRLPVILRGVSYAIDRVLYALLERFPNLSVETAKYLPFRGIEEVVRRFGPGRLVFGSEAPYLSPGAAVAPILSAAITDTDKRAIAAGNLRRLVGGITYEG
jgi:hypothetical protein